MCSARRSQRGVVGVGRGVEVLVVRHRRRRFGISDLGVMVDVGRDSIESGPSKMSTSNGMRLMRYVKSIPPVKAIRTYTCWQGL
jgi:hypothetical protein